MDGPRLPRAERIDGSGYALGSGRSLTFPFAQWRARDRQRTVFFDEGQGRPVVLVHGIGGNATHWEPLARELVADHRVIGLDLVGCGWSAKPRGLRYTIDVLCEHLLEFLASREVRDAVLVGHSLGAAVCVEAALRRRRGVAGLALICPAGVAPTRRWIRLATPLVARRGLLFPYLRYGGRIALGSLFVDRPRDNPNVEWFLRSTVRDEPRASNIREMARVSEQLTRDVVTRSYAPRLAELPFPVEVLQGAADPVMRSVVELQRGLARLPTVSLTVIERCGHLPWIERPRETLALLRGYLQRL